MTVVKNKLTGQLRLRKTWTGRLVMQVAYDLDEHYLDGEHKPLIGWRDAKAADFISMPSVHVVGAIRPDLTELTVTGHISL